MLVEASEFLEQYQRFVNCSTEEVQRWLDLVEGNYCPAKIWGEEKAKNGIKLLTAHFLEMEWTQTAQTGSMATEVARGGTVSAPTSLGDDFSLTTYGRQYLALKKTVPIFGALVL